MPAKKLTQVSPDIVANNVYGRKTSPSHHTAANYIYIPQHNHHYECKHPSHKQQRNTVNYEKQKQQTHTTATTY